MELFKLDKIIAIFALSIGSFALPAISASSDKYHCQEISGVHSVYSRVPRGDIKLMQFDRNVNQKWSIASRCQEVALRFQRYYDNGILRYIGAGYLNNQPVLCAIVEADSLCRNDNILVTLPPDADPIDSARLLMNTRGLALGRTVAVSGADKIEVTTDSGNTYYNLEALEKAVLEKEDSERLIPISD